jgi:hypothetical protein
LKKQLEDAALASASQNATGPEMDSIKVKLTEALAEVSSLKSQLQSVQSSHQDVEAKLEAMKKSKADVEMAAAAAAGPDAVKALAEKQALCDERDRAVTKLSSQTQAWSVEREQLKKDLEEAKSTFESKLAAASKVTPVGADPELAAKLDKLDSILKASIKTGDLRGNAVAEVGKVIMGSLCINYRFKLHVVHLHCLLFSSNSLFFTSSLVKLKLLNTKIWH